MSNNRAKALLEAAQLAFEEEPAWIKEGRKPDFYCFGSHEFWCEVKTLERTPDSEKLGNAALELTRRAKNLSAPGRGITYFKDSLSARDAKVVMQLLKRALSRFGDPDPPKRIVALIPRDAEYGEFVKFSISTKEHVPVEVHSCVSATGKYGIPMDMRPEPTSQIVRLRFSSGGEKESVPEDCLTWNDDFRVAIVGYPDPEPFEFVATMQTGKLTRLKNPERIRDATKDANEQFENGLKYKEAPCLLMIFHDGLDVPDEMIIKSALYGDLKYVFPRGNPKAGKLQLDGHGAFNSDRRREISAVMYVRNGGAPLIIHNRWAFSPSPKGAFACKEIFALDDGAFAETDYSSKSWKAWLSDLITLWSECAARLLRPSGGVH